MEKKKEIKKRNVAFEKSISDLNEDDLRVKVVGKIIEKDPSNNSIVIKFNEDKLRILLNEKIFKNVEKEKTVRVIGIVAPPLEGNSVELKGELVEDFSGLDLELYEKYLKLKKLNI